jgi:hypothetical protein
MQLRLLTRDEVELIWTIDRSEVHHHIYELREGQLVRTPKYFEIPRWRPDAVAKETPVLLDCFDRGGTFLGVFDGEALIGMGVVESARVGRASDQMQLAYLYVSRAFAGAASGCSSSTRRCPSHARPARTHSTYPPHPPRTPSTSTSIEAAYSRLSPTQGSWRPSPTTSTSSVRSDARPPRRRGHASNASHLLGAHASNASHLLSRALARTRKGTRVPTPSNAKEDSGPVGPTSCPPAAPANSSRARAHTRNRRYEGTPPPRGDRARGPRRGDAPSRASGDSETRVAPGNGRPSDVRSARRHCLSSGCQVG